MDFKKIGSLVFFLLLAGGRICTAQTGGELFNQKKTQERYNIEQLAASKVYYQALKRGFTLASSGLRTVQGIKHGSFSLDSAFLGELGKPGTSLRHMVSSWNLALLEKNILHEAARGKSDLGILSLLSGTEKEYLRQVYSSVQDDSASSIDQLRLLVLSTSLKLSDPERMARLQTIRRDAQDAYDFVREFHQEATGLQKSRKMRLSDNKTIQNLYAKP